MPNRNYFA